jgi:hypothetical protein
MAEGLIAAYADKCAKRHEFGPSGTGEVAGPKGEPEGR